MECYLHLTSSIAYLLCEKAHLLSSTPAASSPCSFQPCRLLWVFMSACLVILVSPVSISRTDGALFFLCMILSMEGKKGKIKDLYLDMNEVICLHVSIKLLTCLSFLHEVIEKTHRRKKTQRRKKIAWSSTVGFSEALCHFFCGGGNISSAEFLRIIFWWCWQDCSGSETGSKGFGGQKSFVEEKLMRWRQEM